MSFKKLDCNVFKDGKLLEDKMCYKLSGGRIQYRLMSKEEAEALGVQKQTLRETAVSFMVQADYADACRQNNMDVHWAPDLVRETQIAKLIKNYASLTLSQIEKVVDRPDKEKQINPQIL